MFSLYFFRCFLCQFCCSAHAGSVLWIKYFYTDWFFWLPIPSILTLVCCNFIVCRGSLKSPWSRRKRKHALSRRQWSALFSQDGKLRDGGVKFLKKVRSAVSTKLNSPILLNSYLHWVAPKWLNVCHMVVNFKIEGSNIILLSRSAYPIAWCYSSDPMWAKLSIPVFCPDMLIVIKWSSDSSL